MARSRERNAPRVVHLRGFVRAAQRALAALAFAGALLMPAPAISAPSYMSYFGLAWNIPEVQDHVNLYWAVSWSWDMNEVLSELADARARGMRAIVHTEFAFFTGSGTYANTCPYTFRSDAAARWDTFARALASQGLLETVAAFYPLDEPDLCGVPQGTVLSVLSIIRAHPLTAGKPIGVIFTCDVAQKYGGVYQISGGHEYGDALRAYDWAGFDCYGSTNIFTDPAWTTLQFNSRCFCFERVPGPSYYDNFKAQLNLATQRVILVPQGFVAANDAPPDNPQLFANRAAADPSVILLAPFTWFDMPGYPGVRSQTLLAQQWRAVGRSIALANPPKATPALPTAVIPRLQVGTSDLAHFSVRDLTCNASTGTPCSIELNWELPNKTLGTQLFMRQAGGAPQLLSCSSYTGSLDLATIAAGTSYTFELYQMGTCAPTIVAGAMPVATASVFLLAPSVGGSVTVVEYYNATLDHYFITWMPDEIAKLDDGSVIKGWARTGKAFKTYTGVQSGTSPVCRFYIPPALGDSHFFGRGTVECNATAQKNPTFMLEDPAFMQMYLPVAGVCPANTTEVYRVFDNRPDANHRYMTDKGLRDQMVARGWVAEGDGPNLVVMCAPQ